MRDNTPHMPCVNAKPIRTPPPANLAVAFMLSELLERLERGRRAFGAEQYRSVVRHLAHEFLDVASDQGLGALLDTHPAAAELYENLHYRHAGLCRSPLDAALAAELEARRVIDRVKRQSSQDPAHGQG
jgi:hypothetical protein